MRTERDEGVILVHTRHKVKSHMELCTATRSFSKSDVFEGQSCDESVSCYSVVDEGH